LNQGRNNQAALSDEVLRDAHGYGNPGEIVMIKILLGGVVGGLVIFFWGFVSHMVLPLGEMGLRTIPNEDDLNAAIKTDVREPGLYFVPGRDMSKSQSEEEMQAHMDKVSKGPYGYMVIYPNGRDSSLGKRLPIELGTNVVCALLSAILVTQLRAGFIVRVACVTLVGILASIMTLVPYWNWYGFPTDFTLAQIVHHTVGWFLAGLVLALIVRPAFPKATPVA
jgi:hypothetical protein